MKRDEGVVCVRGQERRRGDKVTAHLVVEAFYPVDLVLGLL